MLLGNNSRRTQRITVGVIIGVIVLSLALSLLSAAAAPSPVAVVKGPHRAAVDGHPREATTPAPVTSEHPLVSTSGDPKPVTKTPQGQATQVTDAEHIGGLIGFIAFMVGGVLLLIRGRRRDRQERRSKPILS
ncbi:MAG TPA: hypothetical protein VFT81_00190 [Dermatophilaceae bacterium]|nr:hypothetical protein [Dermatophilaceae bacterium]